MKSETEGSGARLGDDHGSGAQGLRIAEKAITYHEREGEATLDSFQNGYRVTFVLLNALETVASRAI